MSVSEAVLQNQLVTAPLNVGIIKIEGEDAQTFLHNQFTNDLKNGVTEANSQLSAYCSPKGRMLALFRIFKQNDAYFMVMPRATLEATIKRLRMFVLMSKVTLTDVSDEMVCIGISGPDSEAKINNGFGSTPTEVDNVVTANDATAIRVPGETTRFEIFTPKSSADALINQLKDNAAQVEDSVWELLNIRAGIPVVHIENVEAFVPQMTNLQAVNGLSFKKGCYPGQEVVARMQYLGKLKRRMYLLRLDSVAEIKPGDEVFTAVDGSEHKAGTVVCAQSSDSVTDLLAVVEIASTENTLHIESSTGPALSMQTLPYSIGE